METFYYGDPRNEIDKSQKKISRLWSLVITLIVISLCTIITYFVIDKRTTKLSNNLNVLKSKTDTTKNMLVELSSNLSSIEGKIDNLNTKIDSLEGNVNTVLNVSGKGSKIMSRIEKKTDTIILLINK